jgi:UDP-N-acetylmuramoyl-tripeptide--D-alanyl-D-alanine ligase
VNVLATLVAGANVAATVPAGARWLRVAQREHYLSGSVTRFAFRWWSLMPLVWLAGAVTAGVAFVVPAGGFVTAAVVAVAPVRLGVRGRTSRLAWTRRLRMLAVICGGLEAVVVGTGFLAAGGKGATTALPAGLAALAGILSPLLVDAALAIAQPIENALAGRFVARAKVRLDKVRPRIVAITGSYGKTSTKGYAAHLLGGAFEVVPSPASYNNRAGLARTVNEKMLPSTEVLVAEMGAYGPGEIARLCRFLPPEVAVITAIGPVHLERFGTLERTLAAKAEITSGARSVVLAVDDERLAGLADQLDQETRRVVRCSGRDPNADVAVTAEGNVLSLHVGGRLVGSVETEDRPVSTSNVACAAGVALEMGVPADAIVPRLASLPVPANRLQVYPAPAGFDIVDDTFNANPAGAAMALELLASRGATGGRRVVVTPGMVELGPEQWRENERFGKRAAAVAQHVIVVGRTNRRALLAGVAAGPAEAVVVANRDEAVRWVREHLGPGDVVLYENDLPDHFP